MMKLADKIAALLPRIDGNPAAMIQLAGLMRSNHPAKAAGKLW
jgi:hypothetical protein